MNMPGLPGGFSLRDYLAYLFPGLVAIGAYCQYDRSLVQVLGDNHALGIVALLVGGFVLGAVASVLGRLVVWPLACLSGDAIDSGVLRSTRRSLRDALDRPFKEALEVHLRRVWGDEILSGAESNLLYLCWRDVQRRNHQGVEYLFRLVTLHSMALSFIVPLLALALTSGLRGSHELAAIVGVCAVAMYWMWFDKRREFVVSVYRIWYVLASRE